MKKVGFIGLGIMGKPMALNLMKAGFELCILNKENDNVKELVAAGATIADSLKAMAEISEVVITMVPDTPQVEEVVLAAMALLRVFIKACCT